MKTEQKIYLGLGILVLLVAGLWLSQRSKQKELAEHSAVAAQADLPTLAPSKDDVEKVNKIEIKNADKSDVTLEKKGDSWEVTKPISAKANASNVRSLLDNLKELKAKEAIDRSAATYPQYELTDDKAVHVVTYKDGAKTADLYFGKSGSRGQMVRIAGKDGVFVAGGYSGYLYTREVKNWRETAILKFEDENAIQAEVENKNGKFSFSKNADKWSGTFAKRGKDGKLGAPEKKWDKFDPDKVKDMLRAYKALNAEDFGDEKADTGIADAAKEGGIVHIKLKDNGGDYTIKVGKTAKGSSRYAMKDGGDNIVYVLASWSADWATAEPKKFEKADEKSKDKDKKPDAPMTLDPGGE